MYQNQVNNTLNPLPHSIELPQHGLAWSGEPSDTDSVPSLIDADSSTDSDTENSSVGTFDFLKEEPLEVTHLENIFDEELGSPIKTDRELVRLISLELAHIDNRRCDSLRESREREILASFATHKRPDKSSDLAEIRFSSENVIGYRRKMRDLVGR